MPGMETAAPDRTETSSGLRPRPNRRPVASSNLAEVAAHLLFQAGGPLLAVVEEGPATLGGDRKARRHRQAGPAHGGQAGPLAAKDSLARPVATRPAGTKRIDPARRGTRFYLPFRHTSPFLSVAM